VESLEHEFAEAGYSGAAEQFKAYLVPPPEAPTPLPCAGSSQLEKLQADVKQQ
jgi:hypothetical protein